MTLELHNVTIGGRISGVSAMVGDGQRGCVVGREAADRTLLLRAVLGFVGVDGGHISIDGELLTPLSAPYFRRWTAYVPRQLSVPDGYTRVGDGRWGVMTADERYLWLVTHATMSGRPLLVIDEPAAAVGDEALRAADRMVDEAMRRGTTVLMVTSRHDGHVRIQL